MLYVLRQVLYTHIPCLAFFLPFYLPPIDEISKIVRRVSIKARKIGEGQEGFSVDLADVDFLETGDGILQRFHDDGCKFVEIIQMSLSTSAILNV